MHAATDRVEADTLEAVVARVRGRDQRALGELYDATVDRVFSIAVRVLGDGHDAEEAVADVYAQVWQSADRFDPARGGVLAWLTMLAHSRAIDRRRRRGEGPPMLQGDDAENVLAQQPSEARTTQDLVDLLQHGSALRDALAQLGAQPRELIGLAFLEGMSHLEIAARTGLPLGTVKSHIRRGLDSLRRTLVSAGIDAY